MYVDFEYYRDEYGGGMEEGSFPAAERKAEAFIRYLTCPRGDIFAVECGMVKDAVCAAADVYQQQEEAQKRLAAEGKSGAAGIKSENNDGYSVTYVTEQADGQTAEETLRKKVYEAVRVYLLPSGWLSRKAVALCDY